MTPDEQLQLRVRAAERAHDTETEFSRAANAATIKNAEEAIKAALLINGGSSVAMLAFIGTLVSRDYLTPVQIAEITKPLIWFAWGVGAAMIAAAAAYFTNLYIAGSSSRKERKYEEPFLQVTDESARSAKRAEVARWVGIIAMVISIACFAAGLVTAQTAFSNLSSATRPAAVGAPVALPGRQNSQKNLIRPSGK
jgi:hypothetical protein